jgi:hypothetical protein
MNNKYFASLLCISALTFAPACTKKQDSYSAPSSAQGSRGHSKATKDRQTQSREDINTMIESETEVFEMEEEMSDQKIVKF